MTDIVHQLIAAAAQGPDARRTDLLLRAANEIERLREALRLTRRALKEEMDHISDELDAVGDRTTPGKPRPCLSLPRPRSWQSIRAGPKKGCGASPEGLEPAGLWAIVWCSCPMT